MALLPMAPLPARGRSAQVESARLMLARRSDLPLDRDAVGRFLPWLVGFMVLLAALSVAGAVAAHDFAARWASAGEAHFTVQIPPAEHSDAEGRSDATRTDRALAALSALDGVAHAEAVSDAEVANLLKPWLGAVADTSDLPLPHLIAIEARPGAALTADHLTDVVAKAVPGAVVDDHGVWLARITALARAIESAAYGVLGLIVAVTMATVVFATRAGLAVHREAIEVLHLIGAQDGYIAGQFASRALRLGLRGGLLGLALAVPLLFGLGILVGRIEPSLIGGGIGSLGWLLIALLPVIAAAVAMLTARFTVLGALGRMV